MKRANATSIEFRLLSRRDNFTVIVNRDGTYKFFRKRDPKENHCGCSKMVNCECQNQQIEHR